MVDTPLAGINHIEQSQSQKELTANDAFNALDTMAYAAMRGNRIINSRLSEWPEGDTHAAIVNTEFFAGLFKWIQGGTGVATVSKDTDVPTDEADASIFVDVTTADASLAASDLYGFRQAIEAFEIPDGLAGTSSARDFYLGFWVKSTTTGTYCCSLQSDGATDSFVREYSIDAPNAWEFKLLSFPGNTGGTWSTGANVGLYVNWSLGTGTNFQGVADQWNVANDVATANQENLFALDTNEFRMALPRLYIGTIPTNATGFPMLAEPMGAEEARLKRHFERVDSEVASQIFATGQAFSATDADVLLTYVPKRVAPTSGISVSAAADFDVLQADGTVDAVSALTASAIGPTRCTLNITAVNMAAGNAILLQDDAGNNAFIDIDARLL